MAAHAERDAQLPWVEKYRPKDLSELVAHEDIISILNRLISSNKLPHLLFYGPPGTGKTSTILACAKRLYGEKYGSMTLELNASDDRGIDVVRERIKEFAATRRLFSTGVKLVILDEADAMTNDAQFALRRVIERYTKNTRFCLICNYVSKIIPALQSRCTRFRFAPLKPDQIRGRVADVIAAEGADVSQDGMEALLELGDGDMRRVLNILQSAHMAYGHVDGAAAYRTAGNPLPADVQAVFHAFNNRSFADAVEYVRDMQADKGYALIDLVKCIAEVTVQHEMPPKVLGALLIAFSDLEHRLAAGGSETLNRAALVGAFTIARDALTKQGGLTMTPMETMDTSA
mmetsp:Transcript_23432/g.73495  ORF Transcript_23432/g.73495 Transcript_23432/m.73495 type:complete len:345 (-) Transcript_23432:156-1190(-)|eukprot:CAMPEP_0118855276 /NCGR_PEP_ID=MMETSP1163-20130328/3171_1 /TAXON_ID=124430 /ORGANISM="Phaeomonas parva, Strain CCMP2877" /LENGTH=344 /DNA_ID=CAMNT_0006788147 /DNA_START=94 /DNA_END=1128 /DNA_ORIENTATION=+